MQAGNGYWIKMTAKKTLSVSGSAPPAALRFIPDGTLSGTPGDLLRPAFDGPFHFTRRSPGRLGLSLARLAVLRPDKLQRGTLTVLPRAGYWIEVNGPATWILSSSQLPLTVTTRSLPAAAAGSAYTETLGVVGAGPFDWSGSTIAPGAGGNNGIAVGETTGMISGAPSFTGVQPLFLTGARGKRLGRDRIRSLDRRRGSSTEHPRRPSERRPGKLRTTTPSSKLGMWAKYRHAET